MNEHIAKLPTYARLPELLKKLEQSEISTTTFHSVIDTNVLLDIYFWKDPAVDALRKDLELGRLLPVFCMETLEELVDVLARDHFGLNEVSQLEILNRILAHGIFFPEPLQFCGIRCKDTDDQKFLDLALQAKVRTLFSKDKRVLKAGKRLKRFGVTVVNPISSRDQGPDRKA